VEWQAQHLPQLFFLQRLLLVDLVPEYNERTLGELWHFEKLLELLLGLFQTPMFCSVYHEDNAIEGAAVLGPCLASLQMATQIVRIESNVSYGHFGLMRMHCGISLRKSITLEHVQQRGLASVVQAKEHDVGALLEEAKPLKRSSEEINDEHGHTLLF